MMKKALLSLVLVSSALPIGAYAHPGTELRCKSAHYEMILTWGNRVSPYANYAIDGVENEGADVSIANLYSTTHVLAYSLNVDSQPNHFEFVTTQNRKGELRGQIFHKGRSERAKCSVKAVEVPSDRVTPPGYDGDDPRV